MVCRNGQELKRQSVIQVVTVWQLDIKVFATKTQVSKERRERKDKARKERKNRKKERKETKK